jgi:hypothetical protein
MDTTVTPPTDDRPYAPIANELRFIAAAIEPLPCKKRPYATLQILPDRTVEAVDVMALAVLGRRAATERFSTGWRHVARGILESGLDVSIHAEVPGPPDERDAELERLRTENAALTAALSHLGTEGAVAQAKPDTLLLELGQHGRDGGQ